ncbi:hypothetical protein BKP42_41590 [Rhodococcus erythropolis]|nr:hypothetical protein BKP42_41590 [Rhodococcus erythropolis]
MANTPTKLVTIADLAERLAVNELTVRRFIADGRLTGTGSVSGCSVWILPRWTDFWFPCRSVRQPAT